MTWADVDGLRQHLNPRLFAATNGQQPSRKVIYNLIAQGMKVVRRGDGEARRDSKGRLRQGPIIGSIEWLDEFLMSEASASTGDQSGEIKLS